jgi:hypothetical protein
VSQEKGDPAMMQAFFPIEKEDLEYRTHCAWDSNVGSVVGMALAFTGGEAFVQSRIGRPGLLWRVEFKF